MGAHNKIAIVTGAGSGIGKSVALTFLKDGYSVALAGRRKDALDDLLGRLAPDQPGILVGTQMLAKGHDLPNLTLVGLIGVDEGLFSVDFRASERRISCFGPEQHDVSVDSTDNLFRFALHCVSRARR